MSASKSHYAGTFGRGERPRDVSGSHRCAVCGSDSWCQEFADGTALCKRVASSRRKVNADGVEFFVHRGDSAAAREVPAPAAPLTERASADVLERAHGAVLACSPLLDRHAANLRTRGLTDVRGYGSLRIDRRAAIARAIVDAVGEVDAFGVPGVAWREADGRRWLTFTGAAGLLVPVRDLEGRRAALLVRRDEADAAPKYLFVSSARHGGAKAWHGVHVPVFAGDRATVRVTEGPLKADIITALSGVLTIAVPGVGSWSRALPVLEALGARRVLVAFDADFRTIPHVARALRALVHALDAEGYAFAVETWDARLGKGLDDVLARGRGSEAA